MTAEKDPVAIVRAFVDAVNAHDADRLASLMSEDHCFIDSLGQRYTGRQKLQQAWRSYFLMFPDYTIAPETSITDGDVVAMFGMASGTLSVHGRLQSENRWALPAAWRIRIHDGLVAQWQIYTDNHVVFQIIGRAKIT